MLEYCKYQTKLTKLFRGKESLIISYDEKIRLARSDGKLNDEIESLENTLRFEEQMVDEEISVLVTNYLINKAKRKFIPTPSIDSEGMWEQCGIMSSRYILTNNGIATLRTSLRKELKEKIEVFVIVATAFTGIIGATTGLIAVIMK